MREVTYSMSLFQVLEEERKQSFFHFAFSFPFAFCFLLFPLLIFQRIHRIFPSLIAGPYSQRTGYLKASFSPVRLSRHV